MKIFSGWRQAGLVMRWARQQPGVHVMRPHYWDDEKRRRRLDWIREGNGVGIAWEPGQEWVWFDLVNRRRFLIESAWFYAAPDALRVLAALDLIPEHLLEPDPLDVACPECEVRPGSRCTGYTGRTKLYSHPERHAAAEVTG